MSSDQSVPPQNRQEQFYRSLAESAHDFIFVIDLNFNVSYCNDHCAQALGKTLDKIIGRSLIDLFPSDVAVKQKLAIQQVIDSRRPLTADARFAFPGGTVWLSTSLSPLFNEKKELVSVLGISRDITAQKNIEEQKAKELEQLRLFQRLAVDRELKLMEVEKGVEARDAALAKLKAQVASDRQMLSQTEQKYIMLLDSTPVAIGISDLSGNVVQLNKGMEEMTGYTLDDYRKIKLADTFVDQADRERLLGLVQSQNRVHDFEVRLKHKNGTVYSALLNVDLVEIGGIKVFVTTCRDISELEKVRATLRENEAKIKKLESAQPGIKETGS